MVVRKNVEAQSRFFTVELRRTVVEQVSLSVEAASLQEARQMALDIVEEGSDPDEWELEKNETFVTDAYPE